ELAADAAEVEHAGERVQVDVVQHQVGADRGRDPEQAFQRELRDLHAAAEQLHVEAAVEHQAAVLVARAGDVAAELALEFGQVERGGDPADVEAVQGEAEFQPHRLRSEEHTSELQ